MAIKLMDLREFQEFGYLQEVNRLFLHPLGLALMITIDEEHDSASLAGIIDEREGPEGIYFYELDVEKAERVRKEWAGRAPRRRRVLGNVIQKQNLPAYSPRSEGESDSALTPLAATQKALDKANRDNDGLRTELGRERARAAEFEALYRAADRSVQRFISRDEARSRSQEAARLEELSRYGDRSGGWIKVARVETLDNGWVAYYTEDEEE